uniref:Uncharacterized protein n=1 Tax=Candidatus Kentrum sp. FM TaxID=2126340 RepID=A0A450TMX4_9GAMM|nr:MAG: hypothetical protein BECKFM1743A_GA0114220_104973 [Candidatus Kentron sp. FM]
MVAARLRYAFCGDNASVSGDSTPLPRQKDTPSAAKAVNWPISPQILVNELFKREFAGKWTDLSLLQPIHPKSDRLLETKDDFCTQLVSQSL